MEGPFHLLCKVSHMVISVVLTSPYEHVQLFGVPLNKFLFKALGFFTVCITSDSVCVQVLSAVYIVTLVGGNK